MVSGQCRVCKRSNFVLELALYFKPEIVRWRLV